MNLPPGTTQGDLESQLDWPRDCEVTIRLTIPVLQARNEEDAIQLAMDKVAAWVEPGHCEVNP